MTKEQRQEIESRRYKIGQIICRYRELADETQSDLGRILGVRRQMISKYELGTANLPLENAQLIADHYKISLAELLGESNGQVLMSNEIPLFKESVKIESMRMVFNTTRYYFEKQTVKNKEGKVFDKTYRLDENIFGLTSEDLYAIEITDENNPLNVPVGSLAIVKDIKTREELPDFKKPIYVVLEWNVVYKAPEELGIAFEEYVEKHPVHNMFIAKVEAIQKVKDDDELSISYIWNQRVVHASLNEIKKMCRGIIKKVVIDF